MSRLSWRWWSRNKSRSPDEAAPSLEKFEGADRRQLLQALSAIAGSGALAAMPQSAEAKDASELPPPKRALTGRDDAGKSVFKSFDVTSKVVEIDSNPGLTFHELYMTEGVPKLTGLELDPMLKGTTIGFPGPGGTMFSPDLLSAEAPRRVQAAARCDVRDRAEGIVGQAARYG